MFAQDVLEDSLQAHISEGGAVQYSASDSVVSDYWEPLDCSPPGSSVHGIL